MHVALYHHPIAQRHRGPAGHPERPERIGAVVAGIRGAAAVTEVVPEAAALAALTRVHDPEYVRRIEAFCSAGGGALDPDTYAVPETWEAALRAAGAGLDAAELLRGGFDGCAFSAMRPPGHHAERDRAMGFCIFDNAAVAAAALADGAERVAVVDWDVHHGNGTQQAFYDDPRVLYVSLHQYPWYPGTGRLEETGAGAGAGTTVNLPLPAGTDGRGYRVAFRDVVLPILRGFAPDWILVSAGYDAHRDDPLAEMRLVADDYRVMAGGLAEIVPTNRLVFFLEGGYHLAALEASARATIEGVGRGLDPAELDATTSEEVAAVVAAAAERLSRWWDLDQAAADDGR